MRAMPLYLGKVGADMLALYLVMYVPITNLSTEGLTMKNLLKQLWNGTEGQDLTEYALLVVLIALAAIAAMTTLGSAISNVFSNAAGNLAAT